MAEPAGNLRCIFGCWAMAALAGVLAAVLLMAVGGLSLAGSIFCGVLLLAILGFLLPIILCRPLPTMAEAQARHSEHSHAAHERAQGDAATSGSSTAAAAGATAAGAGAVAAAAMSSGAQADGATTAGDASADAAAADANAKAAADRAKADADAKAAADRAKADADAKAAADRAKADADAKAAADRAKADADAKAAADRAKADADADAKAAASASAAAASGGGSGDVDYDGDGVLEGKDEGTRPAGLDAPRGGSADNLKEIKGVGPKMEKLCNSLGFWHFDQIAAWSADEVAWVDANLEGFKGRVTRDTWVEQAKILASGGSTAFSKKVEDGDVY